MGQSETKAAKPDRKLGDEWLDWDGQSESADAGKKVFLGMAGLSIAVLVASAALFLWLIDPRLQSLGHPWPLLFSIIYWGFSSAAFLWVIILIWAVKTGKPAPRIVMLPNLINRMVSIVSSIGRVLGISTDRIINSFLKVHNLLMDSRPTQVEADRLMVLAPRCLTKENNKTLRQLRDQYGFHMAVVGGGSEARLKIRQAKPRLIIAMACERDLMSGFKEINPSVPVLGFPNQRPEGPCKNTCVDMVAIEKTIRKCLGLEPIEST